MTDSEILAFTRRVGETLPPGYGFLCEEGSTAERAALIVEESEPPLPPGKLIWIAKRLLGGSILKGALLIAPDQETRELEERAWVVLSFLAAHEKRHAARFN